MKSITIAKQIDAELKLLGVTKQIEVTETKPITFYIKDKDLLKTCQKLFEDGHHARAVEEAFKLLNNIVKKHAKTDSSIDGSSLMKKVFSATTPILKINSGTTKSEQDEQLGYMEIFSGCMTGIRNPRAHEHEWEDTQDRAIQLLILADHLIEKVKLSVKQ